jgi:hypothetical protein
MIGGGGRERGMMGERERCERGREKTNRRGRDRVSEGQEGEREGG